MVAYTKPQQRKKEESEGKVASPLSCCCSTQIYTRYSFTGPIKGGQKRECLKPGTSISYAIIIYIYTCMQFFSKERGYNSGK